MKLLSLALLVILCGCSAKKQQVIVVHDEIPVCPQLVSVYEAGTSRLVPLYADDKLQVTMVNPFTPVCKEGPSYTFWTSVSNLRVVEK
jgi:hypothetical protein